MNRTGKLIAALPAGVDAFITTNERTCLYLSGFAFSDGAIFVTGAGAHLFTDFRYIEAAESETEGFLISTGKRFEEMRDIIAKEGIKTVGFEDDLMTVSELEGIKKQLSSVEFMPVGATVRSLAEHKDEDEIEKIKAAQRITDEAFTAVVSLLRYDMTEIEVAAEIEYQMKKRGAIRPSFETIAVSGTNSSRPHGVPRNVTLEKGFLTMDFGCVYGGYASDMTRTVVIGKADEEMKRLYNTLLLAQTTAINSFKPGMLGKDLDKIARDIIDEAGYKGCFGHGLGHGVGVYIHENPRVSPAGLTPLTKGHVFTVEPGIYLKGKYGCRIEDMMIVTAEGGVDITKSRKDLTEI